ncbi:major facilitator superfamily domain-containing protein [Gymnopilus junonius]|uniref:Major facilitator superfamily domain-containing protein n=1 Tax=Gymnopilus junonius TaxID=109634 RepID=A0A9P5NH65_GYMJU|nr:major facilitator superfamily domain-containing protein [Gymnopilus junonius]
MPQIDEETHLLADNGKQKITPLPWFQICIIIFLQLAEPLTGNVVSPFAPQLIRDLNVTHGNESHVGYYVGLLQSLFFLTEACTVLHWSRMSDYVGRKPVILIGLFGLALSMYCFGLSKSFWGLVLSRSLCGALNGNVGVIKSMIAEITDLTNISQAYAYMPLAWNTGGTLGPMIGGWLSRPAERFPEMFGRNEFLKEYPYFLPCAVPATFTVLAWIITYSFLEETLPNPIPLAQYLGFSRKNSAAIKGDYVCGPQYHDDLDSPISKGLETDDQLKIKPRLPIYSLFTERVIIAAGNYASLALVDIAFRSIQPVFFSTPVSLGGLGLPPSTIGNILAGFGVFNGLLQAFFFPRANRRWGPRNVFMWGLATVIPAFATFPLLSYLARTTGYSLVLWIAVAVHVLISIPMCFSYGAIFIFIANASPDRSSIGATNGLSQMSVSIMRAVGPAAATSLFSLSIEKGCLGGHLVYYLLMTLVGVALYISSWLPRRVWTV